MQKQLDIVNDQGATASADLYAENLATQLRKGFLAYCVLMICSHGPRYTSEIIQELRNANMVVVEGTIYPLLNRLQKDGILQHEWQESEQGPPRKYYSLTNFGEGVLQELAGYIVGLHDTLEKLKEGVK